MCNENLCFLYRTCGLPTPGAVTACQVRVAALCRGPTHSLSTLPHRPCSCSSSKVTDEVKPLRLCEHSLVQSPTVCPCPCSAFDLLYSLPKCNFNCQAFLILCLHFSTRMYSACCLFRTSLFFNAE